VATRDLIETQVSRLGQSQDERDAAELGAHFVDLDERSAADRLVLLKKLARHIAFYDNSLEDPSDWTAFFPASIGESASGKAAATRVLSTSDGTMAPHLGLLATFVQLFDAARAEANTFTARHLDFFYQRVLRFEPRPAVPDRAHVAVELKPGTSQVLVRQTDDFSAGKDATGVELHFKPAFDTVVNRAALAGLKSVHVDTTGDVRFAPVANSSNGLGADVQAADGSWSAFGHDELPVASIGFAIASPTLRMAEGHRSVRVSMTLGGSVRDGIRAGDIAGAFNAFLTGEKGWLGPFTVTASGAAPGALLLDLTLAPNVAAVVDYNAAVHGFAYDAVAPVLQFLLDTDGGRVTYRDLAGLSVRDASVSVRVEDVTASLTLESDAGQLNPKKAFLPFGGQPTEGARFLIGCDEALSKKLSALSVDIRWQGLDNLATRYANYNTVVDNGTFKADVTFQDAAGWTVEAASSALFAPLESSGVRRLSFDTAGGRPSVPPPPLRGARLLSLHHVGLEWADRLATQGIRRNPVVAFVAPPLHKPGFIALVLRSDFMHAKFRKLTVEHALKFSKGTETTLVTLNEPYTPTVQAISLSYSADSGTVNVASSSVEDFTDPDLQFYHVGCFGQMRDHGYQRAQFPFVANKDVPLLPTYENEGELMIGLRDLAPNDSVSVLFQVSDGSADPDLERQPVSWWVLCNNYWKALDRTAVIRDGTHSMLRSGVVQFVVPPEATTRNTIMPTDMIWLKAAVARNVDAVSRLVAVVPNVVEVVFDDRSNDPNRLTAPLASETIAKWKFAPPALKGLRQPYASFGGRPTESAERVRIRAAERLRHRRRCITAWDYERIVLEEFPSIHRVKCVPHASDTSWLAPGNVLLVVVPDIRGRHDKNPLEPKVDADTLVQVAEEVRRRCGMQVTVRVRNPRYQRLSLNFALELRPGFEWNYYSAMLNSEIVEFLSPWAFDNTKALSFGGRIYRSVLLDFVEEREYVDYVADFKMFADSVAGDVDRVSPTTPDAILVSAPQHEIRPLP
jgi:hypothetical protein